ncbi:histidine phosphotransferase family protein [Qingshengfaniella alkalisoli]|nr:histidine phosphotransferase family protein [Qingshengfaniella alkalisoli]
MQMSNTVDGPEAALITESLNNASARIRFYRLAFGSASEGQTLSIHEIKDIFGKLNANEKVKTRVSLTTPLARHNAKLVGLMYLCAETALPYGGTIELTQDASCWSVTATGARLTTNQRAWNALRGDTLPDVTPAQIQFVLLPEAVRQFNRKLSLEISDSVLQLSVT